MPARALARDARPMNKGTEIVFRSVAVGLMLLGAMMLIAGQTSVLPFSLITLGIALTVIIRSGTHRHGVAG